MKKTPFGIAVIVIAALTTALAAQTEAPQPNILLILADDLGVGSINAYGAPQELVRTPALNRLAEDGMMFTYANAPASVCSPTRYAMLTGRYAWREAFPFAVHNPFEPASIPAGTPTLASFLQSVGYRTAAIGKWHLGYGVPEKGQSRVDFTKPLSPSPNDIGFDYHFGMPQNLDDGHRVWIENDRVYGLRSGRTSSYARNYYNSQYVGFDAPQRSREKAMEELTNRAIDWIRSECRQESARPFFLYFAPPAVHHPIVPSEYTRGTSECGAYGDFIHDVDLSVGRLVEALAYEGILDNTLIVFSSDNGADIPGDAAKPERQAIEAGLQLNGPLRGDKHTIFEGGLRVPLLVRWPGHVAPGTVSDHMVSLVDLYATFVDAFGDRGLTAREAPDSFSFLPALLGDSQPPRQAMTGTNVAGILALHEGEWKLIEGEFPDALPENHPWRNGFKDQTDLSLYNLADDPGEQENLVDKFPEVVQRLQRTLDQYRTQGRSRE